MQFTKMHGIGNDYVYINGFTESVDDPATLAPIISNRHTGVGGDGLILILPPSPETPEHGAHVRMQMFNADGSEGEMCGNGIRCVAKYVHDHGLSTANPMRIETGAGLLTLDYTLDVDGKVETVTVDMGEPILEAAKIPVTLTTPTPDGHVVDFPLEGFDMRMTCVSMGNPHAVIYCNDVTEVPLETVGSKIEQAVIFPNRINVHFVQCHSEGEVTMRTWERGSGITQACGTGACAVCVAGVLTGRTGRNLLAHLPGGDLTLEWREDDHVLMTGPATEVFTGQWKG